MSVATVKCDIEIQEDVLKELRWDPRVDQTEVGVQVERGIVTLTGTIANYAKKLAAKQAAHRVSGVLDVVNNLIVAPPMPYARSDQDIAYAIRQALEWDVLVPHERIHSTVSDGWVTLEGEVGRWPQRDDAEHAIQNLPGVRGVRNQIIVRPVTKVAADELRTAIEAALDRQAHREARRIGISVQDGVVTLTGNVRSWAEKQAIHKLVHFAPGVRRLEDRLAISSGINSSERAPVPHLV